MALVTGTPVGNIVSQDDITLEGAAYVYFQDATATPLNNPDGEIYYWGLSGTSTYPAYNIGCLQDMALGQDVTVNAVRCDTIGDKDVVQRRNFLEVTLSISSFFPLTVLRHILSASVPNVTGSIEKMGIGKINNNQYYMVWMPKVYDEVAGDYVAFHLHRAKFVDAWSIAMRSGEPWQLTGIRLRGLVDEDKPAGQEFATVIRADVSAVP